MAVKETQKIGLGIRPPRIDLSKINPLARAREIFRSPQREEFDNAVSSYKTIIEGILNRPDNNSSLLLNLDAQQSKLFDDIGDGLLVTVGVVKIKNESEMTVVDSGGHGEMCVLEKNKPRFFEISIRKNGRGGVQKSRIERSFSGSGELRLAEMERWIQRVSSLDLLTRNV